MKVIIIIITLLLSVSSYSKNPSLVVIKTSLQRAAKKVKVDYSTLSKIANIESNFNSNARNKNSSARGLFQIIKSTEKRLRKKYDVHGNIFNPYTNSLLAAYNIKETLRYFKNKDKSYKPEALNIYFAHFMGAYEGYRMSRASDNRNACSIAKNACKAHKRLFKNKKVKDIKQFFQTKLDEARVL